MSEGDVYDKRKLQGWYPEKRWYDDECKDLDEAEAPIGMLIVVSTILTSFSIFGLVFGGSHFGPPFVQSAGLLCISVWMWRSRK